MRFATDDRVTVTDPSHRRYGQSGVIEEHGYDAMGRRVSIVRFANNRVGAFTVDQLDFTEEAPSE